MTTDDLVTLLGTKEIMIADLRMEFAKCKQELEQLKNGKDKDDNSK